MSIKLGVIAALPFEAACFTNNKIDPGSHQTISQNLIVYYAGMGPENATQAAQSLIDLNVDALVSWGVAGALDSTLNCGDIVLPLEVIDDTGGGNDSDNVNHIPVHQPWHTALSNKLQLQGLHADGAIISSQAVQHAPHTKSKLRNKTQAIAIDMESAAIAKVALKADKPFIIVRSIFDTLSMTIPQSSTNATDQYGQVSIPKLMAGLLRHPSELLQYPNLVSSFGRAKKSLQQVVKICGNELCFSEDVT